MAPAGRAPMTGAGPRSAGRSRRSRRWRRSRRSRNDIDLYLCGNDGRVYTAWWRDGAGWSSADDGRWSPLGAVLPAGAPVTALTRSRGDIDLYATGNDGHVGTTWWRDGEGWTV